jgi:hypothetical protein
MPQGSRLCLFISSFVTTTTTVGWVGGPAKFAHARDLHTPLQNPRSIEAYEYKEEKNVKKNVFLCLSDTSLFLS